MKKIAALLMVLSLALFNVGCEPADDTGTTGDGGATTTDGDTGGTDAGAGTDTSEGEVDGAG